MFRIGDEVRVNGQNYFIYFTENGYMGKKLTLVKVDAGGRIVNTPYLIRLNTDDYGNTSYTVVENNGSETPLNYKMVKTGGKIGVNGLDKILFFNFEGTDGKTGYHIDDSFATMLRDFWDYSQIHGKSGLFNRKPFISILTQYLSTRKSYVQNEIWKGGMFVDTEDIIKFFASIFVDLCDGIYGKGFESLTEGQRWKMVKQLMAED